MAVKYYTVVSFMGLSFELYSTFSLAPSLALPLVPKR